VIREVAKHMHFSPAVLITQIRTRVEGSGIPEAKALMRSTSALRQALEREKKKVRQLSGTVKDEWMSAEEEEEEQEGNPRFIKNSIFAGKFFFKGCRCHSFRFQFYIMVPGYRYEYCTCDKHYFAWILRC
jgi:hypothetical protein